MLGGQLAQPLQETGQWRRHADVELDRLHDDGRDLVAVRLQDGGHRLRRVERRHDRLGQSASRLRGSPAVAGTVVGDSSGPIASRGGWMLTSTSSWWPW
jgi:hypothetical protein